MPHKHKVKLDAKSRGREFNLDPSTIARPLRRTVKNAKDASTGKDGSAGKVIKRKPTKKGPKDDTPRAFARLMALSQGVKFKSGLDDGLERGKSRRAALESSNSLLENDHEQPQTEAIKIQPGERLSSFSARVDAALPLSGMSRTAKGLKLAGIKHFKTKTERRMEKMHAEWRKTDAAYKDRLAAAREEEELESEDESALHGRPSRRKLKLAKKNDDDPWAVLKAKRKATAASHDAGLTGVHDVVQAPPQFSAIPSEKFKPVKQPLIQIPSSAGSLRRRQELSDARDQIVHNYRKQSKGRVS